MARIIECKKLQYNWHEECVGNLKTVVVESYEVGKDGVASIEEICHGHYRVFFSDGRMINIHNPNKAEFRPVTPKEGSNKVKTVGLSGDVAEQVKP